MTAIEGKVVAASGRRLPSALESHATNFGLKAIRNSDWQDDQLVVGVPNRHFQEWLEKTFAAAVSAAAAEVFGQPMRVRFTIDAELFQAVRRRQKAEYRS